MLEVSLALILTGLKALILGLKALIAKAIVFLLSWSLARPRSCQDHEVDVSVHYTTQRAVSDNYHHRP